MAIQFNCPYCTATIQVPDTASGKKGTCPQCQTKLVVPTPKNAPPPSPVSKPPSATPQMPMPFPPAAAPPGFAPQWPVPPGAGVPQFPPMPVSGMSYPAFDPNQQMPGMMPAPMQAAPPAPPSLAAKYKRRQSNAAVKWIIGIVVVVAIGAGGYLWYDKQAGKVDPMKGELTAARHADGKLEPVMIHRDWIGLDDETVKTVLDQLNKRAVTLRSEMMVLKLQGAADGIKVTVAPGIRGELVSVDLSGQKAMAAWYKREVGKLSDKHQKDVARAAQQFVQDWAEAEARGEKKRDFGRYHDELGIAALAMGVGSETVAIVGQTIHRCVAEQQGKLFFMLPPGVEKFELQGDQRGKTKSVFPGHFKVKIASAVPSSSKKTKSDKEEDDDMEKPADEAKTKAFGVPAINDPSAVDESMPEKKKAAKP